MKKWLFTTMVCLLALGLLGTLFFLFQGATAPPPTGHYSPEALAQWGNTQAIGRVLFTEYLLPFEVASLLLLVAIVGAVVLARKKP
jgi:NADH-quinone oxidoreductase subunit J